MKQLAYLFFSCSLSFGCRQAEDKPLAYDSSDMENAKAETLLTTEIAVSGKIANPQQMTIVGDSQIVLFDNSAGTLQKC